MSMRVIRSLVWPVMPLLIFPLLTGCGSTDTLPEVVVVELPDGSTATAEVGTGASSLASTRWTFFRTADNLQGGAFATIRFGENGNLEAFENNTLAVSIFGDEIIFDNTRRATKQAGLSYLAATFGAETTDTTGFSFEGRMTAFAAGIPAGFGTATATGTFEAGDPDTIRGTFTFKTEVTLIDLPEANQEDTFTYVGRRVIE